MRSVVSQWSPHHALWDLLVVLPPGSRRDLFRARSGLDARVRLNAGFVGQEEQTLTDGEAVGVWMSGSVLRSLPEAEGRKPSICSFWEQVLRVRFGVCVGQ